MLDKAISLALSNNIIGLPKMAAIIVLNKEIVGIGLNSYKTHPLQNRFSKTDYNNFMHAEIAAINNALKKGNKNLNGASIYIARVLKNNKPALAKPCEICNRALKHYGIEQVFYTID